MFNYQNTNSNQQNYPYLNSLNANTYLAQQKISIPTVNGKSGAEVYALPPDSSIILMDTTAPRVWLKKTDSGGFATLEAYQITKEKDATEQKSEIIEQRLNKLEELINDLQSKYQSYAFNAKQQSATNRPAVNGKIEKQ